MAHTKLCWELIILLCPEFSKLPHFAVFYLVNITSCYGRTYGTSELITYLFASTFCCVARKSTFHPKKTVDKSTSFKILKENSVP